MDEFDIHDSKYVIEITPSHTVFKRDSLKIIKTTVSNEK